MIVAAGIVILAIGVSKLASVGSKPSDRTLVIVGLAILDVCWALLVVWTVWSIHSRSEAGSFAEGTMV